MIYIVLLSIIILYAYGKYFFCSIPEAYTGGSEEVKKTKTRIISARRTESLEGKFMVTGGVESIYLGLITDQIVTTKSSGELKKGDLVVIFQNDEVFKGYKIRKLREEPNEGVIKTLWYDRKGKPQYENYRTEDIIGIINEKAYL